MIRHLLLKQDIWDKTAVICGGKTDTYRDLAQKAFSVQSHLPQKPRENIALFFPSNGDYIAAFFGTLMAGMAAFPLNTALTVHEIAPLLAQASVQTVVTSTAFRHIFQDMVEAGAIQALYMEELPAGDCGACPVAEDIGPDETMLLLATSGTTGKAKLVKLSERNVAFCAHAYIDKMDYEKIPESEVRYIPGTPLPSAYGLLVLSACMIKAFPLILLGEGFSLDTLYRAVQEHKATHYEGGPLIAQLMAQMAGRPIPYDISSLRYLGFGGSKVSAETLSRLIQAYPGVEFWPGYGTTEASPLIAKPDKKVNMEKLASVGTAIQGMTIMVDVDGVLADTPYLRGEVAVKGPNVMLGYYKNEEDTQKAIRNGYLYTGDIGYLDEEGYLYICGRKKNVIMVRGFSVYAEEVEACILQSGLVKDCIVYGQADALGSETVCADIIPMTPQVGVDDIRAYCGDRLSGYKQPQRIKIVDAIQKTATGKSERVTRKCDGAD